MVYSLSGIRYKGNSIKCNNSEFHSWVMECTDIYAVRILRYFLEQKRPKICYQNSVNSKSMKSINTYF